MFNWLKRVFEQRSVSLPAVAAWTPQASSYLATGRGSSTSIAVDRLSVMSYPAVWGALRLVGGKVGRLDLNVYKRDKKGGRTIDNEHPAQWLLAHRPSNLYAPNIWKSVMVQHAMLHGNSFSWIIRDNEAVAQELIILNPENVGVASDNGRLHYIVRMGNSPTDVKVILPENMLHIKNIGHDGILGYSVIDMLRESFGLGLATQRYGAVYFRNNASPGPTILKFPNKLDADQLEYYRNEWDSIHGGIDRQHRTGILANGGDIIKHQIDNESAQFLATREFEIACGVANIFGIPPHKLGVMRNGQGYGSIEAENRAFLTDCLDYWLVNFEEECEAKLLKESQMVRDSHFIEFDRRSLQQADPQAQSTINLARLNQGGWTYNQYCHEENLPGIGPDGDRMRVQTTTTFLDLVDQEPDEPASTDAAEPAESTVAATTNAAEPTNPAIDVSTASQPSSRSAVKPLLTSVVKRYLNRLAKAAENASRKPAFSEWVKHGLEEHRSVLVDSIAPACPTADDTADQLLTELRNELENILPEQAEAAVSRIDPDKWTQRILNEVPA